VVDVEDTWVACDEVRVDADNMVEVLPYVVVDGDSVVEVDT
jgi:hypothetical protein